MKRIKRSPLREELQIVDLIHAVGQMTGYDREDCVENVAASMAGPKADDAALSEMRTKVRKVWDARFCLDSLGC